MIPLTSKHTYPEQYLYSEIKIRQIHSKKQLLCFKNRNKASSSLDNCFHQKNYSCYFHVLSIFSLVAQICRSSTDGHSHNTLLLNSTSSCMRVSQGTCLNANCLTITSSQLSSYWSRKKIQQHSNLANQTVWYVLRNYFERKKYIYINKILLRFKNCLYINTTNIE